MMDEHMADVAEIRAELQPETAMFWDYGGNLNDLECPITGLYWGSGVTMAPVVFGDDAKQLANMIGGVEIVGYMPKALTRYTPELGIVSVTAADVGIPAIDFVKVLRGVRDLLGPMWTEGARTHCGNCGGVFAWDPGELWWDRPVRYMRGFLHAGCAEDLAREAFEDQAIQDLVDKDADDRGAEIAAGLGDGPEMEAE